MQDANGIVVEAYLDTSTGELVPYFNIDDDIVGLLSRHL